MLYVRKVIFTLLCIIPCVNLLQCPGQHFIIQGMKHCQPYLNCQNINDEVRMINLLGSGYVKSVYFARWKQYGVVVMKPKNFDFIKDFQDGLAMLKLLNPSNFVVQLLGYCNETNTIVTEYYKNGDATNLLNILRAGNRSLDTIQKRLELCINYAQILEFLHNGPFGTRVACDSNDLEKLLSQFLITSELTLVLNDVDALPQVRSNSTVLCGGRALTGEFVAPEQRSSKKATTVGYNEKTDIWKAASVCQYFLQDHEDAQIILYHLFDVHRQCKNKDPKQRPSAKDLVESYTNVLRLFSARTEL